MPHLWSYKLLGGVKGQRCFFFVLRLALSGAPLIELRVLSSLVIFFLSFVGPVLLRLCLRGFINCRFSVRVIVVAESHAVQAEDVIANFLVQQASGGSDDGGTFSDSPEQPHDSKSFLLLIVGELAVSHGHAKEIDTVDDEWVLLRNRREPSLDRLLINAADVGVGRVLLDWRSLALGLATLGVARRSLALGLATLGLVLTFGSRALLAHDAVGGIFFLLLLLWFFDLAIGLLWGFATGL